MERKEYDESIVEVGRFIAGYSSHMMGCGVHTSRVVRCSKRIAAAYGYKVNISLTQKNLVLTIIGDERNGELYNEVVEIPTLPISFSHNAELSSLSWQVYDCGMSLEDLWREYDRIISEPRMDKMKVMALAALANASFCRLFGGDWISMGIVLLATMAGVYVRNRMQAAGISHYIVFIVSAFTASMCSTASLLFEGVTSDIAIATSVLYLIPGVPLINGVIDIIEGYVITGFVRLVQAALLVISLAVGMSFTLVMFKDALI